MSRRPGNDKLPYRIDLTFHFKSYVQLNLIREDDNIQNVQVYTKIKVSTDSEVSKQIYILIGYLH